MIYNFAKFKLLESNEDYESMSDVELKNLKKVVSETETKDGEIKISKWATKFEYPFDVIKKKASSREWSIRDEADLIVNENGDIETQETANGPFIVPTLTDDALKEHFKGEFGRIREVIKGPDNLLYISISNRDGRGNPAASDDRILRINPTKL